MEKDYHIIFPESKAEWDAYYQLRYEVLRKPWGQPESSTKDEWEDISIHLLMLSQIGEAVATGRLQLNSEQEGQIRSMAVKEGFRNQGLGSRLLNLLEEQAKEKKLTTIILDAREKAVNFYLQHGYYSTGSSYTLFNEIRHQRMEKKIG